MKPQLVRISTFLSLVLRHDPGRMDLELDAEGWADVEILLERALAHGRSISREQLRAVVEGNDKKRFSLSEDGRRIRARQGHSIPIDLGLEPREPQPCLFHGTATRFLTSIFEQGLNRGQRRHVHLSADPNTAIDVGRLHGQPVVLEVDASTMHADGREFFRSENGVWLTPHVPPEYLSLHRPSTDDLS